MVGSGLLVSSWLAFVFQRFKLPLQLDQFRILFLQFRFKPPNGLRLPLDKLA